MSEVVKQESLLKKFSGLVALPHTVFALPFALSALLLASSANGAASLRLPTLIFVVLAVVSARIAAMAFNRLVDARFDAMNPRTRERHIPAGLLSKKAVLVMVLASCSLFLIFAGLLGQHCLMLAPFVLLFLLGYSLCKRFTDYSHLVLGLALGLAPGGAWWVLRPELSVTPILLMAAVMFWVAGFDVLYSCQDVVFDKAVSLRSIPVRFGVRNALKISKAFHLLALAGFFLVGFFTDLGFWYFVGMSVLGGFLLGQHFLITDSDLSRVNRAFFTFNGIVSLGYFLLIALLV